MQQKTRAGPGVFRNENDMISAEKIAGRVYFTRKRKSVVKIRRQIYKIFAHW
mgnify:CR=1